MDSDTARPLAIAILAVVAIGLAAATLNSAVVADSSGGFGAGAPDSEVGVENGSQPEVALGNQTLDLTGPSMEPPCYPVLNTWWAMALVGLSFVLLGALLYRRYGPLAVVTFVGPVGVPLIFAHSLLTLCDAPEGRETDGLLRGGNVSMAPSGGSGAPGSGTGTSLTDPSVLLLAGLAVALAAAVALLVVSSGGDDPDESAPDAADDQTPDVAAVGRAAGAAADRIEASTDVDNEVYRAWREMTAHLDVERPASSTPAEFADAAADAGMTRADVDELTDLFELVRYGGESPTADREQRALDALRRIERAYADGAGADSDGSTDGPDAGSGPGIDGSATGPGGDRP